MGKTFSSILCQECTNCHAWHWRNYLHKNGWSYLSECEECAHIKLQEWFLVGDHKKTCKEIISFK